MSQASSGSGTGGAGLWLRWSWRYLRARWLQVFAIALVIALGTGSYAGLLSLTEIPRRLALDFTDFFKSGLAFNQITGSFTLDGGNAYTEDLRIDGPAAEIRVRGRTGRRFQASSFRAFTLSAVSATPKR